MSTAEAQPSPLMTVLTDTRCVSNLAQQSRRTDLCTCNVVAVSCYPVSKGCRAGAGWPRRDPVGSVWEDFKGAVKTINIFIDAGEKVKVVLFHPINLLQPEQQEKKEMKKRGGRAKKKKPSGSQSLMGSRGAAIGAVLIPPQSQLVPSYWLLRAMGMAAWQVYRLEKRTVKNPGRREHRPSAILTRQCGTSFARRRCSLVGLLNIAIALRCSDVGELQLNEKASFFPLKIKSAFKNVFGIRLRLPTMIFPPVQGIFLNSDSMIR